MTIGSIILLDAGTGNLFSVQQALLHLGARIIVSSDANQIRQAQKIIMPGVGAFSRFMEGMRSKDLDSALAEFLSHHRPLLGICVGMQALFSTSSEMGKHSGLNLISGTVTRFEDGSVIKVPHTGWNQLWFNDNNPLLAGLTPGDYAYFNHSYYCQPDDNCVTSALTDYGTTFCSVVHRENIFGVQFHPEKSQKVGLQILHNFINLQKDEL